MGVNLPPKILRSDIADAMRRDLQGKVDKNGTICREDVVALFDQVYDEKSDKVSTDAAEALAYVSTEFKGKMDQGALQVTESFVQAYYTDMMGGLTAEYQKQAKEMVAQNKKDFQEFMHLDHKEHKEQTLDEFKEDLKENRLETSDWETLQLWLKTGVKRNPYSN